MKTPSSNPESPDPSPFEKFADFARRIIAVPKAEADEEERKWREEREANAKKKLPKPR